MSATMMRRISRLEARLPPRLPSRSAMLREAASFMSDHELRTIASIRRNETDDVSDEQAQAIARMQALADEQMRKWAAT